jgi:hypothetical protein
MNDIDRVEDTLSKLEAQRAKLDRQLNQVCLTSDKKERLKQYAVTASRGLEEARKNFNLRKEVVDLLGVQVRLIREDGKPIAYVTCILQDVTLELSSAIISPL